MREINARYRIMERLMWIAAGLFATSGILLVIALILDLT